MRTDIANARALIALLFVVCSLGYVANEYRNARGRVEAEDLAARNRRLAEIESLRRRAIEAQPEVYVPAAPINVNVF
ncbi:hypothetical protein IT570_07400 [Candidatus Sumerlaeota bacterium]|nr:hypothetical protein [Candidatus Sumerlaeota bacterium]